MTKKMKRFFIMCAWCVIGGLSVFQPIRALAVVEPKIDANAAFVVDYHSQKILVNQNGDTEFGIASITKILGAYIVLEAVETGRIKWDDAVTISDYAYRISQDYELSNVPLVQGGTYTVKELYDASLIYSANGAIIALAEHISGSEAAFVQEVSAQLTEWDIQDHHLYNITGLSPEDAGVGNAGEENTVTARGLALAMVHLLQDYPQVLETTKVEQLDFAVTQTDSVTMVTRNMMLPQQPYAYDGVDGLKTGTTDFAKYSFLATAEQNGMRLITVVLGAQSNEARFRDTASLLDYAFKTYRMEQLAQAGDPVAQYGRLAVVDGKQETVGLRYEKDVHQLVHVERVGQTDITYGALETMSDALTTTSEGSFVVKAPVNEGAVLGRTSVVRLTDDLGYLTPVAAEAATTVSVVADAAVEERSLLEKIWHAVASFVIGVFRAIVSFFSGLFGG